MLKHLKITRILMALFGLSIVFITGCKSKKQDIKIEESPKTNIVFIPAGEGKANCFQIGDTVAQNRACQLKIFNRWGSLVYSSEELTKCWNGKIQNTGTECAQGVYIYMITLKNSDSNSKPLLTGQVTLIRNE